MVQSILDIIRRRLDGQHRGRGRPLDRGTSPIRPVPSPPLLLQSHHIECPARRVIVHALQGSSQRASPPSSLDAAKTGPMAGHETMPDFSTQIEQGDARALHGKTHIDDALLVRPATGDATDPSAVTAVQRIVAQLLSLSCLKDPSRPCQTKWRRGFVPLTFDASPLREFRQWSSAVAAVAVPRGL